MLLLGRTVNRAEKRNEKVLVYALIGVTFCLTTGFKIAVNPEDYADNPAGRDALILPRNGKLFQSTRATFRVGVGESF